MRIFVAIRRAPLLGLALLVACDNASPNSNGNSSTGEAPGNSGPGSSGEAPKPGPACVGLPGRIHPNALRGLVESIPAPEQNKLREAITKEDATIVPDAASFTEYLGTNGISTIPIQAPAAGCPNTNTLLFPAHTFEKSTEVNDDVIAITPCLGLTANPNPSYWHCAPEPAVDAYNQKNCIDPAFKGLGCAPIKQEGLSIVVDKNPCFEQAKQAGQPIHATTKATLTKLGITQPLVEKPYAIQKCLGEQGDTWLVGPETQVESGANTVTCHGFENPPASNELDCYQLYPEDDPKIPVACGPLWVCLSRP